MERKDLWNTSSQSIYKHAKQTPLCTHTGTHALRLSLNYYFHQVMINISNISFVLGDIGGYMGLFIGGSAITICELLDLVILNSILKYIWHRKSTRQVSASRKMEDNKDDFKKEAIKSQAISRVEFTSHAWKAAMINFLFDYVYANLCLIYISKRYFTKSPLVY